MRRTLTVSALLVVLATLGAVAARADVTDIVAPRAEVADPLTGTSSYFKSPGIEEAAMASTTKIMTMHVVLEEVAAGHVLLSDMVQISGAGDAQGGNQFPQQSVETLDPGDQMTLDHALHAISYSANDVTQSVAEFVANAVPYDPNAQPEKDSGDTQLESAALTAQFVQRMNDEAAQLGLTKTHFQNPVGWDHPVHYTTTGALIELWEQAAKDRRFLTYMGTRNHTYTWLDASTNTWLTFAASKQASYYPGVDGWKNGITPNCIQCLVTQATRLGRRVISAVLQSTQQGVDSMELLRHAYKTMFHPKPTTTQNGGAATAHGLDCHGLRGLSAFRTPADILRMTTWETDAGNGVWPAASTEIPAVTGFAWVDVAFLRSDAAVVATRTAGGAVDLHSLKVDPSGVTSLASQMSLGFGSMVVLRRLTPDLVAAAILKPGGGFRLWTLTISPNHGFAVGGQYDINTPIADELALASAYHHISLGGAQSLQLVAAVRDFSTGKLNLNAWEVDSATGALTFADKDVDEDAKAIGLTSTGYGRYAASFVSSKGSMKIKWLQLDSEATISVRGDSGETGEAMSESALASIGSGLTGDGALAATRDSLGNLKLSVWEFDARQEATDKSLYRLAENAQDGGAARQIEVCRTSNGAAAGDFLTAVRAPGGNVTVMGWRIGKKP